MHPIMTAREARAQLTFRALAAPFAPFRAGTRGCRVVAGMH